VIASCSDRVWVGVAGTKCCPSALRRTRLRGARCRLIPRAQFPASWRSVRICRSCSCQNSQDICPLAFLGSCFLGLAFGHVLQMFKEHKDRLQQWMGLSVVLAIAGVILNYTVFPINKVLRRTLWWQRRDSTLCVLLLRRILGVSGALQSLHTTLIDSSVCCNSTATRWCKERAVELRFASSTG
jgi:hypothetical protein